MKAKASPSHILVSPFRPRKGLKTGGGAKKRPSPLLIRVAPDKSMTHRAVMFAAMAKGRSLILNPLLGEDCLATMAAMQAMGVRISFKDKKKNQLVVDSEGIEQWHSPLVPLNFGNSGTTTRLLLGLLSGVPGLFATCFGDQSLSSRPMGRVIDLLRQMGAEVSGRQSGDFLPIAITGKQLTGKTLTSDKASAQVKSAVLLAGLGATGRTTITLPKGGRDHTENFLRALGVAIEVKIEGPLEHISLQGSSAPLKGRTYPIPGDPSSAAFFAALAAITPGLELKFPDILLNPTRIGFCDVLRRMGLPLVLEPSRSVANQIETTGVMGVSGCHLGLVGADTEDLNPATFIDEVPILAVVAAFAHGQTRFRNLKELRVKESDRLLATAHLLKKAGARVVVIEDDLLIGSIGKNGLGRATAFSFDPDGDHRLAMAAAIMAKRAKGPCKILNPECVDVSFPGFFEQLGKIC